MDFLQREELEYINELHYNGKSQSSLQKISVESKKEQSTLLGKAGDGDGESNKTPSESPKL